MIHMKQPVITESLKIMAIKENNEMVLFKSYQTFIFFVLCNAPFCINDRLQSFVITVNEVLFFSCCKADHYF